MGPRNHIDARRHGERGAALYIVTMSMFLFIGMGALAIDLASMYVARAESQRAADAAALAGANYFAESGCVTTGNCNAYQAVAIGRATEVAAQSFIEGQPATIVGTPTFNENQAQNPQITVQVQSNGLNLFFLPAFAHMASLVGANVAPPTGFNVGATATAEAYNPSGFTGGPTYCTGCTRPWLIANCDQSLGYTAPTNAGCTTGTQTATQAYLLDAGNNYAVANPSCTPTGVVGAQIEIALQSPTNAALVPPTTLYAALDNDNPGLANFNDYQNAISTCMTGQTTCGQPTLNVLPIVPAAIIPTQLGVESILHTTTFSTIAAPPPLPPNPGAGSNQDWIDTTVCPPQIHAGGQDPLVTQGIVAADSPIATSDSIVTAYIFDIPPGGTGLVYNTLGTDTAQTVNIVGFAQIFVTQVDQFGNVYGVILGVAGCGSNSGGTCGLGSGNSQSINGPTLIPVRLITQTPN